MHEVVIVEPGQEWPPPDAVIVIAVARASNELLVLDDAGESAGTFASTSAVGAALTRIGFTGEVDETAMLEFAERNSSRRVLAVGIGDAEMGGPTADDLRDAAGAAMRRLRRANECAVAIAIPIATEDRVESVVLGAALGAYRYNDPTRKSNSVSPASTLFLRGPMNSGRAASVTRASVMGAEGNFVRDLVNAPPNSLTPDGFVELTAAYAEKHGLVLDVLREPELTEQGYGGLSAVGAGSQYSPALLKVEYVPSEYATTVALVGKGITYDSGGISLKPVGRNEIMKMDMAGAAAVLSALAVAAQLELSIHLVGWMLVAENMPSGDAMRPGDVLTMYDGTSVEVVNTDAEGRLVLADGIARASEDEPDAIVDIATLTGEMMSALGTRTIGAMSNDQLLLETACSAAASAGENCWPMPLLEDVRTGLRSPVADIANMGYRYGGGIAAGLFLEHFVPTGTSWLHLDIAGPSYNEGEAYGCTPKGATGAGMRTLVAIAEHFANQG